MCNHQRNNIMLHKSGGVTCPFGKPYTMGSIAQSLWKNAFFYFGFIIRPNIILAKCYHFHIEFMDKIQRKIHIYSN